MKTQSIFWFFLCFFLVVGVVLSTAQAKRKAKGCKVNGEKIKHRQTVIQDKDYCSKIICKKGKLRFKNIKNCQCSFACPTCLDTFDPVCGSNGVTYDNSCLFGSAAVPCGNEDIELAHTGPCEECPTFCPEIFAPVCGSNSITYENNCTLQIASCNDPSIVFAHDGPCAEECPTFCPAVFEPVCGSDGITYSNDCQLGIANCNNPSIVFAHDGPCDSECKIKKKRYNIGDYILTLARNCVRLVCGINNEGKPSLVFEPIQNGFPCSCQVQPKG